MTTPTKPAARPANLIGGQLRAIRSERQMSLRDLARQAEISASMLSQIETGKAYPSVRSLYSIAAALDVSVDAFFPQPDGQDGSSGDRPQIDEIDLTASEMRSAELSRAAQRSATLPSTRHPAPAAGVLRSGTRPTIELNGGITWERLTAMAESGAEFLEITYAPGAASGQNRSHHAGREFGLVTHGTLTVELGFETHTLAPGDSIIFDSATPHRLLNRSERPARAVWVVLNQG